MSEKGIVVRPPAVSISDYNSHDIDKLAQVLYENDLRIEKSIGQSETTSFDPSTLDARICANSCVQANSSAIGLNTSAIGTNATSLTNILAGNTDVYVYGKSTLVFVKMTSNQIITSGTSPTIVNYDNIVVDNKGEYNATLKRFAPTIPTGETYWYNVVMSCEYSSNAVVGARFGIYIYRSGSIFEYLDYVPAWNGTYNVAPKDLINTNIPMTTGQYLDFRNLHNGGGTKTIPAYANRPYVSIFRVG